jgi:hypothetical protein
MLKITLEDEKPYNSFHLANQIILAGVLDKFLEVLGDGICKNPFLLLLQAKGVFLRTARD